MPASVVRCANQSCRFYGRDRRAEMAEAGEGLFHVAPVACECGWRPQVVDRWAVSPTPPETAVRTAPEKRAAKAARKGT